MKKEHKSVTDIINERAIHRVVKPGRVDPVEFATSRYDVGQSKAMERCPACAGSPDLSGDCPVCEGRGKVRSNAIERKLKDRVVIGQDPLITIMRQVIIGAPMSEGAFKAAVEKMLEMLAARLPKKQ